MQAHAKMAPDVTKVCAVIFGAIGLSLADVKLWLQIAGLAVALAYALWKWRREFLQKVTKETKEDRE